MLIKKLYLNPFMKMYNNEIFSSAISVKPRDHSVMTALK
ncbi:hypothetical protein FM106_19335 [Brachybacterium faecium]|nr:hypothetical protein FM106_19335 [Brachybacterium faecium]